MVPPKDSDHKENAEHQYSFVLCVYFKFGGKRLWTVCSVAQTLERKPASAMSSADRMPKPP